MRKNAGREKEICAKSREIRSCRVCVCVPIIIHYITSLLETRQLSGLSFFSPLEPNRYLGQLRRPAPSRIYKYAWSGRSALALSHFNRILSEMMLRVLLLTLSGLALCQALFFGMGGGGGGGGGCCCGCGTPQPPSCGCGAPAVSSLKT